MSSPSTKPENVARAAPVSTSDSDLDLDRGSPAPVPGPGSGGGASGAGPGAGPGAGAGPGSDSRVDQQPTTNTTTTTQAATPSSSTTQSPGTPAAPSSSPSLPSSASQPLSPPPAASRDDASHADQNKKPRGPSLVHRQTGPSLLSKALASARGIPPQPQPPSPSPAPASGPGPSPNLTSPSQSRPARIPPGTPASGSSTPRGSPAPRLQDTGPVSTPIATPTTTAEPELYDVSAYRSHGGSLTPTAASPQALSADMLPPAALATFGVETAAMHDLSSLNGISSMLRDHRELLKQARVRGSSLERLERERWVQEEHKMARAHSHSTSPDMSRVASPSTLGPSSPPVHARPGEALPGSDSRGQYRPRRPEHRVSLGPEKIWSIGSGEHGNDEDGQVEKSITEAMEGVEPNARSRKASYSLRYFRQGLPEDKKRRESKPLPYQREKLLMPEESVETRTAASLEEYARAASAHASPKLPDQDVAVPSRLLRARSFPSQSPETPKLGEPPVDYFGLKTDGGGSRLSPAPDQTEGQPVGDDIDASPDVEEHAAEANRPGVRRKSGDSTEVGESHEEGDESGEDQIKSAVFLPHQGLDDREPSERVRGIPPPSTPRLPPSARTLSRGEDFNSWLVKADEPEPDQDEDVRAQQPQLPSTGINGRAQELQEVILEKADECAIEDELPESAKPSRPVSQYYDDHVHDHQLVAPSQPLEAIELIPYKHQVGGHTTLWRFSRRAVCKQLNNRENEFYETVERYHRNLLPFLPRYIGVLNVTFQKQPRRKSTYKREDGPAPDRKLTEGKLLEDNRSVEPGQVAGRSDASQKGQHQAEPPARIISQSLHASSAAVPTVTFDNNWHIVPRNLLQPTPSPPAVSARIRSTSAAPVPPSAEKALQQRPSLDDRHANSWGATTVNKKLRNEVFNDAFLKAPVTAVRHRRPYQRSVPRRAVQQILRSSNSDSRLLASHEKANVATNGASTQASDRHLTKLHHAQSDVGAGGASADESGDEDVPVKDVTGTSAPEPETLAENPVAGKKKRRYSGTGLRRKPTTVTEPRGDLKYFEEADTGYGGDAEETSRPDSETWGPQNGSAHSMGGEYGSGLTTALSSGYPSNAPSGTNSPVTEFKPITRPNNPKEAQTAQRDSRVEYFLLLEDLTAGMKRPCIMDLKMGTRQYGVDATPKKQKSQQRKCTQTTSRELGVRVCGLQVWDMETQSYVFKDKYYGRDLQAGQEFQDALTRFLYNGVDLSSILRHIPTILQKLSQLEKIVRELDGYRFYAASLLMFYDGDNSPQEGQSDQPGPGDYDTMADDSTTDFATDTEDVATRESRSRKARKRNKCEIDFKIADFANSVTKGDLAAGKPCPPQHPSEPDRGFLRGLATLRQYFIKIQRDTRAAMGIEPLKRHGSEHGTEKIEFSVLEDDGEVSE